MLHVSTGSRQPRPSWPDYLRAVMREGGYGSPASLARAVDIDASIISRWINADTQPSFEHLRRLSRRLGIRLLELLVFAGYAEPEELDLPPDLLRLPEPGSDLEAVMRHVAAMDGISDGTRRLALAGLEQVKREADEAAARSEQDHETGA